MRKCLSCGQWLGHVVCLKGQSEQCDDCATVPLRTPSNHTQSSPSPSLSSSENRPRNQSRSGHPQPSPSLARNLPPPSSKCRGSPRDSQGKQRSRTSQVSSRGSKNSTIRSQRVDEQMNQCNCRICVAKGFFQSNSVLPGSSDDSTQSLIVSVPRCVLQAADTSLAASSSLKRLCSKGPLSMSGRHRTHPALTALTQRHRRMKLLKSVSVSRISLK